MPPSQRAKDIAVDILDSAQDWQEGQEGDTLAEKVRDACTAFQLAVVEDMQALGLQAGIVSDPDARVADLQNPGHTVGFVRVDKKTDELLAFDVTIAQNGQIHRRRKARVWFGDAQQLSSQLQKEFGGTWDPFQIKGAVGLFAAAA